ncbi:uncharacterized protein PGTG_13106 [Puccinia graminis f. sp. tritici CRL 75-36-700-3]|uniref:Uncharacterized protein n=1 Tax=Puccinia graminis f. sp. tritici (strain CRL 75-36-700-3 / race SCCL) TaxID=418459 RepID=E3KQZ9_PUCGT|nr:uncharacterized protein PGTG_13106 [Puccinia graminis f. sp. tritici CRL 75-36-700-3]EFP86724.2 hypothetical protein PGTG_13106 [Puccinia graminis f. sp. tritici CRL 75-36-700-3]
MAKVHAGHSSGEYTACVASNAIDFKSGIYLTRLHIWIIERTIDALSRTSTLNNYT